MLPELTIPPVPEGLETRLRAEIDAKAKPPGALGRIEDLAVALGLAQGTEAPSADPAVLLIFAADHGIVAEGVSAWPQEVTAAMVGAFLSGGAAASVFARSVGARVEVCDAGVATPLHETPGLIRAGIRAGTRNAAREDALTPREVDAALRFGAGRARIAIEGGARVVLLGEMGIGNTATAALLAAATGVAPVARLTGRGAGLDDAGLARKTAVLEAVLDRHPGPLGPDAALAAVGGLEIAAMAGALLGAAAGRAVVVVDGFIATAAAHLALMVRPEARAACVFAHTGAEPGHRLLLEALDARPLLDLGLRLGEGTGGLLALPLLRAAAVMVNDMARLDSLPTGTPA